VSVSPAPAAIYPFHVGEDGPTGWDMGWTLEDGKTTMYGPYPCMEGCNGEGAVEQPDPITALQEAEDAYLEACPGSAEEPTATSGLLCIYVRDNEGTIQSPFGIAEHSEEANEFGVTVPFQFNADNTYIRGSWAVAG